MNCLVSPHLAVLLLLGGSNALGQVSSSQTNARPTIEPADVLVHVELVRAEIELIRSVMGKPRDAGTQIGVADAQPREVFFQALILFRTADQLCFEQARQRATPPTPPSGEIQPKDVYQIVDAALQRIRVVKDALGIDEQSSMPARDPETTPTDVFRSIMNADRQLNRLLDRPFLPSDVFQEVTSAIGYSAELIALFPGATRIPRAPEFEPRKQPADVYQRLAGCLELIRQIAGHSKLEILQLDVSDVKVAEVTPSDVYVVASLVASELAYLHAQLPDAQMTRKTYYPGRKFPAHVYQRAGILTEQLQQLEALVQDDPDWLLGGE
jgi:hypothetical protein